MLQSTFRKRTQSEGSDRRATRYGVMRSITTFAVSISIV